MSHTQTHTHTHRAVLAAARRFVVCIGELCGLNLNLNGETSRSLSSVVGHAPLTVPMSL